MTRKTRMLQKENNRLDEQILEENQEKFADMICLCLSILFAINIVLSRDTIEMIKNAIVGGQVNLNIAISKWTALSVVVWVGKGTLFTVNIFVACAVTVALFGLHKGLEILA